MVAAASELRSIRFVHGARGIDVLCGETVIGRVARDDSTGAYRYFPGADNELAFVFEDRNLTRLLRLVETRSWQAELAVIGRRAGRI